MYLIVKIPKHTHAIEIQHEATGAWVNGRIPSHPIQDDTDNHVLQSSIITVKDTLERAELVAEEVLLHNPGYEVWVCTPETILQPTRPEIIRKKVTDKGVLPV